MHLSSFSLSSRRWAASPAGVLYDAQDVGSVGVAAEQIGSKGRPLVEPGSLFCDGNYGIRINTWNSLAGVTLHVVLRFLDSSGNIVDDSFDHTPNTNRTKASTDQQLAVGFPLNVMVSAVNGSPLIGQTYVQVQLIRGLTGATTAVATLLQGYVTSQQAVAWPGSPIQTSLDGGGLIRNISGTLPGAGNDFSETCPTGARWQLLACYNNLVTTVGAGTRYASLRIVHGGNFFGTYFQKTGQAPGTNTEYTFAPTLSNDADVVNFRSQSAFGPDTWLLAGDIMQSGTRNMLAGDQWSAPAYSVREFLEAAA